MRNKHRIYLGVVVLREFNRRCWPAAQQDVRLHRDSWRLTMNRTLAAMCFIFSCALPGLADEREQILGVWKLQTYDVEFQDTGERKALFGAKPNGFIIFTAEGRMMAVLTAEARKVPQTDADRAAALRSMFAYFRYLPPRRRPLGYEGRYIVERSLDRDGSGSLLST